MSDEIIVYKTENIVEVIQETNDITISSFGVQGIPGPTGPQGLSGIISVNNPIINTGTSSSANLSFSSSPTFAGKVTAASFQGDGSLLTSITGSIVTGSVNNAINSSSAGTALRSDVTEQIHVYAKNTSGSQLYKGQAVYITGAQGANLEIGLSQANFESTSSKTFGLLKQDLGINEFGYVITNGIITGIDTSDAGNEGDAVWLSPTILGGKVYGLANKPSAPYHMVYLGVVTRKNSQNGAIFVSIQNGFELQELHNVYANNPNNNDIIVYNSSSGLWVKSASAPYATNAGNSITTSQTLFSTLSVTNNASIGGNLSITGNLFVSGSTASISASNIVLNDPLLYLADGNMANINDIGIVGSFTPGSSPTYQHTGLVRDASDNTWKLFSGVIAEPTNTVDFTSASWDTLQLGNLIASAQSGVAVSVKGASGQNIQEWRDSNNNQQAYITSGGSIISNGSLSGVTGVRAGTQLNLATLTTISTSSGTIGAVIRGASAQSANLQEWQNSATTAVAYITPVGSFISAGRLLATAGSDTAARLVVGTGATTQVGVTIQGSASQTADLERWLNSSGSVLASVSASGNITAASFSGAGTGLTSVPASAVTGTAVTQADLLTTFFGYPANGYETFPRMMTTNSTAISNNTVAFTLFTPIKTVTISTVTTIAPTCRLDYGYASAYRGIGIYQVSGTTTMTPLAVTWDQDNSLWGISNMSPGTSTLTLTSAVASNSNNFTLVSCTGTGASFTTGQWVTVSGGTGGFTSFTGKVVGLPSATSWILQASGSGLVTGTMTGGTASGRGINQSTATITSGSIISGTGSVATASIVCNAMAVPFSPGMYVNVVGSVNSLSGVVAESPAPTATSFYVIAPSTLTSGSIGTGTANATDAWGRFTRNLYVPTATGSGVVTPASVTLNAGTTYAIGILSSQVGGTTSTPNMLGAFSSVALGFTSPILSLGLGGQTTITSASVTGGTTSPPFLWTRMA